MDEPCRTILPISRCIASILTVVENGESLTRMPFADSLMQLDQDLLSSAFQAVTVR